MGFCKMVREIRKSENVRVCQRILKSSSAQALKNLINNYEVMTLAVLI